MIDYSRVLTIQEMQSISDSDYTKALNTANSIIENIYHNQKISTFSAYCINYKTSKQKSNEVNKIWSRNNGEDKAYKALLTANITFNNSKCMIKKLIENSITYDFLYIILEQIASKNDQTNTYIELL